MEVRDGDNHPISGYALEDSISVDRNHIAAPVAWKNRKQVGELAGRIAEAMDGSYFALSVAEAVPQSDGELGAFLCGELEQF